MKSMIGKIQAIKYQIGRNKEHLTPFPVLQKWLLFRYLAHEMTGKIRAIALQKSQIFELLDAFFFTINTAF